jgi:hypothetical protein
LKRSAKFDSQRFCTFKASEFKDISIGEGGCQAVGPQAGSARAFCPQQAATSLLVGFVYPIFEASPGQDSSISPGRSAQNFRIIGVNPIPKRDGLKNWPTINPVDRRPKSRERREEITPQNHGLANADQSGAMRGIGRAVTRRMVRERLRPI